MKIFYGIKICIHLFLCLVDSSKPTLLFLLALLRDDLSESDRRLAPALTIGSASVPPLRFLQLPIQDVIRLWSAVELSFPKIIQPFLKL